MDGPRGKRLSAIRASQFTEPNKTRRLRMAERDIAKSIIQLARPQLQIDDSMIHTGSRGSKIVRKLYGDTSRDSREIRGMFSPSSNTEQCKRAGIGSAPSADSTCWICGYLFLQDDKNWKPNCDHILPVIQGVMFADIALTKKPSTSNEQLIKNEYDWAHSLCNIKKGRNVFITEKYVDGKLVGWESNDTVIQTLLYRLIPDIQKSGIDKGEIAMNVEGWVKTRLSTIKQRMNPLLTMINKGPAKLQVLLSIAKLGDEERLVKKTGARRNRHTKRKRRASVITK